MTTKSQRPRVLLVDDYPDAREMYSEYLQFSGFDVVEAANGIEALEHALEAAPDIILMDLSLPVMDGWEATRRLKSDNRTAGIPVVFMTARAQTRELDHFKSLGAAGVIVKPFDPMTLAASLRNQMQPANAG